MRPIFTIFLLFTSLSTIFSQQGVSDVFKNKGEVYFTFHISSPSEINTITKIISVDNVIGNAVYAYANEEEFNGFLKLGKNYTILPHPGDKEAAMSDNLMEILDWNVYPTYDAYISMMNQFASNYPSLCRIVEAGNTIQGRKILFAVISDNVNVKEPEPQFMFTSSIHGDETTGYVLMLRLIDSLLSTYATDSRIANLVNNVEIWINPLANPDGTYKGGNNSVSGAIRYNANYKDLNRNFPDPDNLYPTGAYQQETIVMMNLADANNFVLSANFHGGAEVVNYPWDTWARLHPDNNWFVYLSRQYADTVHANAPASYMNDFNNGITNGYAWYEIEGGRQDYMTYYKHGREVTIEISNTKLLSASLLPAHWYYNRKSFLNYIENTLYGITGIVTDTSGNPLKAKITVNGHDFDSSEIYSDYRTGNYHRMISPGMYIVTFSAPGYLSQSVPNVNVSNFNSTILNISLIPDPVPVELVSFTAEAGNNIVLSWITATETNNKGFEIERKINPGNWAYVSFIAGKGTTTETQIYKYEDNNLPYGNYIYKLKQIDLDGSYYYSNEVEVNLTALPEFTLEQNYPNPFNPSTEIRFRIAQRQMVKLVIYNSIGQKIKTLVNEIKEGGAYTVNWNGTNSFGEAVSSGVYIYRIQTGSFSLDRKMLLLR